MTTEHTADSTLLADLDAVLLAVECESLRCPGIKGPHLHPRDGWVVSASYFQGANLAAQALGYTPSNAS